MHLQDDKYHHRHQRNRLTAWVLSNTDNTNSKDHSLKLSLLFNLVFVMAWMVSMTRHHYLSDKSMMIRGDERVWHGGHPIAKDHKGSCWCGADDGYCMCTPNVAIDLILVPQMQATAQEEQEHFVWLVRRQDTNQLATMGGFVDVGETVEEAVHRELKEEMGIVLLQNESHQHQTQEPLQLLGVYSDPKRDNRRRNVSVVFVVQLQHAIQPKAADDAKDVQMVALSQIEEHDFFADHKTILLDYRHSLQHNNNKKGGSKATVDDIAVSNGDDPSLQAALAIQRSVCKSIL